MKRYLAALAIIIISAPSLHAQVLRPILNKHEFAIGYIEKYFHRDFDSYRYKNIDWESTSIFINYGLFDWLTIIFEGYAIDSSTNRYPKSRTRNVYLGAGAIFRIIGNSDANLNCSVNFHERIGLDRSTYRYHHNIQSFIGAVQFEKTFYYFKQCATIWLGPAYIYDYYRHYPNPEEVNQGSYYAEEKFKSVNNYGLVVGLNIILFGHAELFVHSVYAAYFQERYGVSYHF